jgi:hypothetical protein
MATMNAALLDLNSSWSDGVNKSQGYGKALLQVDGSLNTASQNGQSLWTKLQALNEGAASAAQATYDFKKSTDGTVPALHAAEGAMEKSWQAAVKAGEKFGLTADQAKTLAAQMGFIPSNLAITMAVNDLTPTEQALLYVQGLADHLPKGATVKVAALTQDAVKELTSVGIKVRTLPGGRQMEITAPTGKAAAALDALIAKKLPGKTVAVSAATAKAIANLEAVQRKVASTKGKSVTMGALTGGATTALQALGFKVTHMKGGKVSITIPTGGPLSAAQAIQGAINNLHGTNIGIGVYKTTYLSTVHKGTAADGKKYPGVTPNARGNILTYAAGGTRESHVAQIARAGDWRVWAEDETGGEAYIPLAASKRARSRRIAAETVKRLGGGPVMWYGAGGITTFASGGLDGFTYSPTATPVLGGPSDAKTRYDNAVQNLKDAWDKLTAAVKEQKKAADTLSAAEKDLASVRKHHHTAAQLRAAEERVTKAKASKRAADKTVSADRRKVYDDDRALGLKKGAKAPTGFNLAAYEKQLNASVAATEKWRGNLAKISKRGGAEVESLLEGMGQDGYALVNSLAGASAKQFNDIVKKLKKTGDVAKATLADFDKQLNASTKTNQQFAADLQKLAAEGYGDLAQALAAQGDSNAQALAAQAASDPNAAKTANANVGKAQNTLTGDDLTNSLILLSTLRGGPGRGYADLIAAGLGPDVIKALVPKMTAQIGALPAANKDTFVRQWVAQGGKPMALGGILTQATPVLAGEAGPEAFIPLTNTARSRALLATTAAAYGYALVPASRYATSAAHGAGCQGHGDRVNNITLNGAKQTTAEQAADLVRHMTFVG